MNPRFALLAVLGGAISATTGAQDKTASAAPADPAAVLQSCSGHKFETTVVATTLDGKPRSQKVKICGVAGQTDADWKRTLEDAIEKTQANEKMQPSVKEQIVTALRLEIGRLETGVAVPVAGGSATALSGVVNVPKLPVSKAPAAPIRPANPAPPRPLEQDYASLKPLPPPLPPAAAAAAAASIPRLPSPRIKLFCSRQGERGTSECDDVYVNTIFTIQADEALAPGTSLRFVRKGDDRANLDLAQMRAGQSIRVRLPNPVCLGVTRSTLDIQVLRSAKGAAVPQVVDTYGPYYLHC